MSSIVFSYVFSISITLKLILSFTLNKESFLITICSILGAIVSLTFASLTLFEHLPMQKAVIKSNAINPDIKSFFFIV
jgi:hypothetical protein